MNRPVTTLFMLMSLDGKISTGACDALDFDRDLPRIPGVREGLHQYYEIEQTTDLWSLNTGRVQAKVGVNDRPLPAGRSRVSFVLLDNSHLTLQGVAYFCHLSREFVLVTSNREHPAYSYEADNLHILYYETLDLETMLRDLYEKFGCERLTIQSGGTLNGAFLRQKLFDYIDVVVAPLLVGGHKVSTLIDGGSLFSPNRLGLLQPLKLESCQVLEDSYLRLWYRVLREE